MNQLRSLRVSDSRRIVPIVVSPLARAVLRGRDFVKLAVRVTAAKPTNAPGNTRLLAYLFAFRSVLARRLLVG